jgi:hypothetical protein
MNDKYLFMKTDGDEHSDVSGVLVKLDTSLLDYLRSVARVAQETKAKLGPHDFCAIVAASPRCWYVGHDYSWAYDEEDGTQVYGLTPVTIGQETYSLVEMDSEPEDEPEWTMENNPRVRVYADGDVVFAGYYKYVGGEESAELISLETLAALHHRATGATTGGQADVS